MQSNPSRLALILALAALAPGAGAQFDAACTDGILNPATGSYYLRTPTPMTYTQARAWAATAGGYLVAINDVAEQVWVATNFPSGFDQWIGLTDESSEGSFVWDSGEPVSFVNWALSEPNDGKCAGCVCAEEDYGVMFPGGLWNDVPNDGCFGPIFGIVEVPWRMPALVGPPTGSPVGTLTVSATTTSPLPGVARVVTAELTGGLPGSTVLVFTGTVPATFCLGGACLWINFGAPSTSYFNLPLNAAGEFTFSFPLPLACGISDLRIQVMDYGLGFLGTTACWSVPFSPGV